MKKKLRVAFVIFLILSVQMQAFPLLALAQEASSSAAPIASSSGEINTPTATISANSHSLVSNPFAEDTSIGLSTPNAPESVATLLNASLTKSTAIGSAAVRQKSVIHNLSKRSFTSNESIQFTVGNSSADTVSLSVADATGKAIEPSLIEQTTVDTLTTITIQPPTFGFRPGKYTLHVADTDGTSLTQDFTWGVLALNTDKSIYLPQETARISLAVLDEKGNMVCDANVDLEITDPAGGKTLLSTATKTITVNPQCQKHDVSLVPDYEASYHVSQTGKYNLSLSATTNNGTNTISDTLSVADSVPFDVARSSATRIYPQNTYPMIFHIKANQNFNGTISDYVPANFTITPYATASAQTYDTSTLVVPSINVQSQFGFPSLSLSKPFNGSFVETQGFGVALTDQKEKQLYAAFGLAGHDGLDFALPSGTPVLAADDGTVALAGDAAYGMTIVLDHAWGRSYYGHLSKLEVAVGQKITKGEEIALSGNTGLSTGAHLHFGIKPLHPNMNNGYFGKEDPSPYLDFISGNKALLGVVTTDTGATAMKVISWNVSMKKGDSLDLAYSYQSPPLSPQLYRLGPLTFRENNNVVFQEQRQWQIAVDANTVTFMEAGTDATQDFSFYDTNNSCTSSTAVAHTGPRSISCDNGDWVRTPAGTLADAGRRISFWIYFNAFPTTDEQVVALQSSANANLALPVGLRTATHKLYSISGSSIGTTVLTTKVWYRISIGYTITSATVDQFRVYLNGNLELSDSNISVTTGTSKILVGRGSGTGGAGLWNLDDFYIDNGSDLSDTGDIYVTNKRPNANGANNQFATKIGSGGSGYGSGHSPQVNEQPLSALDAWETGVSNQLENYQIESAEIGDVNISGASLIADAAWVYANSAATCTGHITNNGTTTASIGLTTTNTMFTNIVSNTSYPDNAAGVGIKSCNSVTAVTLDETGMLIAYNGPTLDQLMRHGKWFSQQGVKQSFTF